VRVLQHRAMFGIGVGDLGHQPEDRYAPNSR